MQFRKRFVPRLVTLPTVLLAMLGLAMSASASQRTNWPEYGGSPDSAQYSDLAQINASNVARLHEVWRFPTGDGRRYLFNPIVVHGVMYVLAEKNSIVALDARTGNKIWTHATDPETTLITNRGINYWESPDGRERRLFFSCDNFLQAIDARTGESIKAFGTGGRVDLREGLGRDPRKLSLVQSTTPGKVFENLLILGSATNEEYNSGPGDVRAYDVRTGKLIWTFHTIPHPGEFGYDTWPPEAWKTAGGANAWSELTVDTQRGIVFVPTASPKYNFYGANRKGADLFGDCLLALDARTGRRLWHFQMVHHDIWDYDNATAPKLLTLTHNGKKVDVVVQVNKEGFVWVFERDTGKPLWPIEERAVPKSDMPGEDSWPTQPFPLRPPPFARQSFTDRDITPFVSPAEREALIREVRNARNQGMFTPPSTHDTVEMPGNNGGANFGGAAVDPHHGFLYVVSKDLPAMLKLQLASGKSPSGSNDSPEAKGHETYAANCAICHGANREGKLPAVPSLQHVANRLSIGQISAVVAHGQGQMPGFGQLTGQQVHDLIAYLTNPTKATETKESKAPQNTSSGALQYKTPFGFMFTSNGLPAISPPWTTLTAYDLNGGTIQWHIPLGDVPELAAKGIRNTGSQFPKVAPVVTGGGLIFTGTRDRKLRALDPRTGKVLWEAELDSAIEGMPAVYELDGREYIVVCASAEDKNPTPGRSGSNKSLHGAYVVFGLP